MFRRGSFVVRLLAFVLLIGILAAAGTMIFRAGQAQGYALGVAASGKDLTAPAPAPGVAPAMPYAPGYWPGYWPGYYYWRPHFFPFGPLFGLFFFLLIFFVIGGMFRAFAWRHHPMMGHGPWGPHDPWRRDQPEGAAGPESGQPNTGEPPQPKA